MKTSRRHVLRGAAALPAFGITTLRLPAALAATSASTGVGTVADGPALTPDDTRVIVAWAETDGVTYTVQQDDGAGGWTDIAASATSPTTVTGLTNDVLVTFRVVSQSESVTFEGGSTSTRPRAAAVGGTESVITVDGAAWRVHVFDTAGTHSLAVRAARDVEYLLVAGGGGGGGGTSGESTRTAGGGGAGGLLQNVGGTLRGMSGDQTIVVGAGGTAGGLGATGTNGSNTTALGLTAIGGGGGGDQDASGLAGGSGGGAGASRNNFTSGGGRTSGQGNVGTRVDNLNGGGGGGAGGAGSGTSGGAGRSIAIVAPATPVTYAEGGDASAGNDGDPVAASGPAGTGNGGAGRYRLDTSGGDGGSGVVVIRYPI